MTDARAQPEWLTPTEVGSILRVTARTVRAMCQTGELRASKVRTRDWRIERAEVEAYLNRHSNRPRKKSA